MKRFGWILFLLGAMLSPAMAEKRDADVTEAGQEPVRIEYGTKR